MLKMRRLSTRQVTKLGTFCLLNTIKQKTELPLSVKSVEENLHTISIQSKTKNAVSGINFMEKSLLKNKKFNTSSYLKSPNYIKE